MSENIESSVLIVGLSARAAAWSFRQRGMRVYAIDGFGDEDLKELSESTWQVPLDDFSGNAVKILFKAPYTPFIYTGGLEDRPDVIAQIESLRPNWGTSSDHLPPATDPGQFQEAAQSLGWKGVTTKTRVVKKNQLREQNSVPSRWLVKPRTGLVKGQFGIFETLSEAQLNCDFSREYLQKEVLGIPCSAAYIVDKEESCQLLGLSEQWIGEAQLNAPAYQWAGNVAPMTVESSLIEKLKLLGEALTSRFRLKSYFGIDFIFSDGELFPIELNPRYVGSVEVHERVRRDSTEKKTVHWGKGIVYAGADFEFPFKAEKEIQLECGITCQIADRPSKGTTIYKGQPICTLLASGENNEEVKEKIFNDGRRLTGSSHARRTDSGRLTP